MLRILFILLIIPVGLAFAGFRVHPQHIQQYFDSKPVELHRLQTANGKTVIGQIVEDSGDSIIVAIDGMEISFSRAEILEQKKLTEEEIEVAQAEGLIIENPKKPIITYEQKDSLLKKLNFVDALIKEQNEIGAIVEKNSPRKKQMRMLEEQQRRNAKFVREHRQKLHKQFYGE